MPQLYQSIREDFYNQKDRWILWSPVLLAFGIGGYFNLGVEPSFTVFLSLSVFGFFLLGCAFAFSFMRPILLMLFLPVLGFVVSQGRTLYLNTPMLVKKTPLVQVTGRVVQTEQRPQGFRVTLDNLAFEGKLNYKKSGFQNPVPSKVRFVLRGALAPKVPLKPGVYVTGKVVLMPPGEPVAPGTYDFRRRAYFEGVGGVGFGTTPLTHVHKPTSRSVLSFLSEKRRDFRERVSRYFRRHLPGDAGAIAAALVTGDRSGITRELHEAFVEAGIAHILAISGLHLSLIAGLIFLVIRTVLVCVPVIALNYSTKKGAAVASIAGTFAYLCLCWGSVSALRAFIMTAIVMIAIMMDRVALSMRTVAAAAFMILVCFPESLLGPSFQLSFAAVTALIAVYERNQGRFWTWTAQKGWTGRCLIYIGGILLTTLVASLATAPYTIHTFGRLTLHGTVANIVAIPLTTFGVMPLLMVTLSLMPFGLAGWGEAFLEPTLGLLIHTAKAVAAWPETSVLIPATATLNLILMTLGALWICIWVSRLRWWGVLPLLGGVFLWPFKPLPDLYISGDGKLIGLRDHSILWVNSKRAGRFSREFWMRECGLEKTNAFPKKGQPFVGTLSCDENFCRGTFRGVKLLAARSKDSPALTAAALQGCDLAVTPEPFKGLRPAKVTLIDRFDVWRQGAHVVFLRSEQKPQVQTVRKWVGNRPWAMPIVAAKKG